MILETERLTLAPLTVEDAPYVYPFMSDPEVMAHWDRAAIEDPDEVKAAVAGQVAEMADRTGLYWAIRHTHSGAFLGYCELVDLDWRHYRGELGFIVARAGWGQGFATEAAAALLAHCASPLGLKRMIARTHVGDIRSEKVLRKLGFEEEGYLKGHVDRDGERRDCRLFGLLF
ncbi:GNAT family N-acetyltransferase [Caulobacter sp. DWR2-3-1b2]|uniref:GNAT family N-acetyltransferase n=1 Tax=unclassified Caulobacter TaxID=2648921 RepID=UPI0019A3F209|nr:GNAT family N-acetyltransferase [Caulobacter sp.]